MLRNSKKLIINDSTMTRAFLLAVFLVISSFIQVESKQSQLRFVNVVFRHGDRCPTNKGREMYPNDPHLDHDYYPIGLGGLTNTGKQRVYLLGDELRKRYNDFLGGVYFHKDIMARCTDVDRTKMSLLALLAALYPPTADQKWHPNLQWQPIPITSVPAALDILLGLPKHHRYHEERERVTRLPEIAKKIETFRPLMNNLTVLTGKPINDSRDMWYLYNGLMAQYSMGLKLPKWTNDIFPYGALEDGTVLDYEISSYTDVLKKFYGGPILKRISDDIVAIIKDDPTQAKKMNLFGCHETTIAALLYAIGVYKPHVPEYSSAVIVELHTIDDNHYVKVIHYRGIPPVFTVAKIPGCDILCPLSDFFRLLKNVTPTQEDLDSPRDVVLPKPS